jgi:hypothetical protein
MEYLTESSYEEMVGKWVQREYHNAVKQGYLKPNQEALVFDEDYTNLAKNTRREILLMSFRHPLLRAIPRDTKWFKVKVSKDELPLHRLIRYRSWHHLTNGSGRMDIAARNFIDWSERPQNIPTALDPETRTELIKLIEELKGFRRQGLSHKNLTTILVGTAKDDTFTILEGNKTSLTLYIHYFLDYPNSPYPNQLSYVGISPSTKYMGWYYQV